jgi:hypothetical protein
LKWFDKKKPAVSLYLSSFAPHNYLPRDASVCCPAHVRDGLRVYTRSS